MVEQFIRDQNFIPVAGGVSNTNASVVLPFKIDSTTGRLLADSPSTGTVTSITTGTGLTGGPITTTGTISLSTALSPMATLTGNSLKVLRVNAGETAVEYATVGSGTVTSVSVTSTNGFAGTVATATTTPAITITTSVTGILKGNGTAISAATDGTDYLSSTTGVLLSNVTTTATASTIVKRDANANIFVNNFFGNSTSTVSAGGTTVLTIASSRNQLLTGSLSQTFQLPDATTLTLSQVFTFNNNSSSSLIITNNGGTTLYTLPAGGDLICEVTNVGSANGSWDFHPLAPGTSTWGSGVTGLVFNTALTTSPAISAGISSAANPSFIPQRGSATTGYGGDSTNLYGSIGGSAVFTATATNFTVPALNKITVTAPATSATLTIADGKTVTHNSTTTFAGVDSKTLTINNSLTLAGTDATTMTFPSTSSIVMTLASADTITGVKTFGDGKLVLAGATSGGSTLKAPAVASTYVHTLPAMTTTIASVGSTTETTNTATVVAIAGIHHTHTITALASANTFGVPTVATGALDDTCQLIIRIKDNATARALSWNAIFRAGTTVALPTTTTLSKTLYVGFKYNVADTKWDLVGYTDGY